MNSKLHSVCKPNSKHIQPLNQGLGEMNNMPSESGDRQPTIPPPTGGAPPQLRCPRCDSTNTKFCYYNNYNFSQPRHFCKSCRRYWTHGGTLRHIPVGGGGRKTAKRSRPASIFANSPHVSAGNIFVPLAGGDHGGAPAFGGDGKLGIHNMCGSFTSLLSGHGPGLLALGGLGLGVGHGYQETMGFGLGTVRPFLVGGETMMLGNTWQQVGGGGGETGDCLPLPDLAISTPRN